MDAFSLRQRVIDDYASYVQSFLQIMDPDVDRFVEQELKSGALWPDGLVQLSPAYQFGATVDDLVADKTLHPLCAKIFRIRLDDGSFMPLRLHYHQVAAIRKAVAGQPYVLTTGTGSGKSLTYLIPIVNHILQHTPAEGKARALIIYPLNALINSQKDELDRYFKNLEAEGIPNPIRYGQYTGQEDEATKAELRDNPPHILLTNYVMQELMLTRPGEERFVDRAHADLRFLVLDELHTYRGRQGADVSLLVRRIRERSGNPNLLCVGTSATMVAGGSRAERLNEVARVAGKIFGIPLSAWNIIDETLVRSIPAAIGSDAELRAAVESEPQDRATWEEFSRNPLAAWVEAEFGLTEEEDGHLRRAQPITLREGVRRLAARTGLSESLCTDRLKAIFQLGTKVHPPDRKSAFAFKLHQFVSQGGSVHATLEPTGERYLTLEGQLFAPRKGSTNRLLYPLVFCRECGQEYYMVTHKAQERSLEPRPAMGKEREEGDGYLALDDGEIWSHEDETYLPENWLKPNGTVKREYAAFVPRNLHVYSDGTVAAEAAPGTVAGWYIPQPFLTCLRCGAVYTKREDDFKKVSRLSSEGRSTATTLLGVSAIIAMRRDHDMMNEARKLMSFTDNRQDASLQSGHFNDFVQVALLRSAIYRAIKEAGAPLEHTTIASRVVEAIALDESLYAKEVGKYGEASPRNKAAFQQLIEYRLYEDLRRGWRIVQPNLEQCGLMRIDYGGLRQVCEEAKPWHESDLLRAASPETRMWVVRAFLDFMRRSLAITAPCLESEKQDEMKRQISARLKEPWAFDERDNLKQAPKFTLGPVERKGKAKGTYMGLGARSSLGRFLRAKSTWPGLERNIPEKEYPELLRVLVEALAGTTLIQREQTDEGFDIQLRHDSLLWCLGDGTPPDPDPVRTRRMRSPRFARGVRQPNRFFADFYRETAADLRNLESGEHTGQVNPNKRKEREGAFKEGTLPLLFCSPTMELGIDIRDLNMVHMRNVPPTPANYAQRSGRAGRNGQAALAVTYCSVGSPHDQYYFRQPVEMVAGAVPPPRLDLGNEELVRSHMHAVWMANVRLEMGRDLTELIDVLDPSGDFPLREQIWHAINLSEPRLQQCKEQCLRIIATLGEEAEFDEAWVDQVLRKAPKEFNQACDRWREEYRTADEQVRRAREIIDRSYDRFKRKDALAEVEEARNREREALRQKDLLCNRVENRDSDFYPYRYFASEGFLPGYNFPRLPLRAFVGRGDDGEYISRPRFLALTEFGPHNIIYHEGRKYKVTRSILPPDGGTSRFRRAKLCKVCGFFHEGEALAADLCQNCGSVLDGHNAEDIGSLFEMTTVSTRRVERITCDEEERVREGYEVTTRFRFAPYQEGFRRDVGSVVAANGTALLGLTYGPAATLWRINNGWRRAKESGFTFDPVKGTWGQKPGEEDDSPGAADAKVTVRDVRVLVRDTRNILLVRPAPSFKLEQGALRSLQYALQRGIQAIFQVEESEIASELIGDGEHRAILFWEASEGGAGVLTRLVKEAGALAAVAAKALELCHFDELGRDLGPKAGRPPCTQACYDCLLSYANQPYHKELDRHAMAEFLVWLAGGVTQCGHGVRSYPEQYQWLRDRTDLKSNLERHFLDHLYQTNRRLPDYAQQNLADYYACPDFYYERERACVFCDGSVHDTPEQKAKDQEIREHLEFVLGYRVIVIRYDRDLEEQIQEHEDLFGEGA